MARARTRIIELASTGIDEAMQGLGADPFGGSGWAGLRVPTLPTPPGDFRHRYLMVHASFSLGARVRARALGFRQGVTIGLQINSAVDAPLIPYVIEQNVESPYWHFTDGDISWHFHQIGPPGNASFPPSTPSPAKVTIDNANFKFNFSQKSALLYGNGPNTLVTPFYTSLTAYTPPNAGRPWGSPVAGLGPFYDLRTESRTQGGFRSFGRDGIELYGNDTYALFTSCAQTNPTTRPRPGLETIPVPAVFSGLDLPEEKFISAFRSAIYWRIFGSLIIEIDEKHAGRLIDDGCARGV